MFAARCCKPSVNSVLEMRAISPAVICLGSSIRASNSKKATILIGKVDSVLGTALETLERGLLHNIMYYALHISYTEMDLSQ